MQFLAFILGLFIGYIVIKLIAFWRTVLYSTIFFPKILIDLETDRFTIKYHGRLNPLITYYKREYNMTENLGIWKYYSWEFNKAEWYSLEDSNPEEIIKTYLKEYEQNVYFRKYFSINSNELSLKEWNDKLKENLSEKFVTDQIDYETYIKKQKEIGQ